MKHSASTQLWIGSPNFLKAQAITHVQKEYCRAGVCKSCSVCKQIEHEQFHACMMLATTKSTYVRSDLDTLFTKIGVVRLPHEPFFCIITQADKLSDGCAHSLLKLLEEPPTGWHWILLTDRPHELLPTITSRCLMSEFTREAHDTGYRQLYSLLTQDTVADIVVFHQLLDRTKITDYESRLLFDDLLDFWTRKSFTNSAYRPLVTTLQRCLEGLPMPGSSKIFWRMIYFALSDFLNTHSSHPQG